MKLKGCEVEGGVLRNGFKDVLYIFCTLASCCHVLC